MMDGCSVKLCDGGIWECQREALLKENEALRKGLEIHKRDLTQMIRERNNKEIDRCLLEGERDAYRTALEELGAPPHKRLPGDVIREVFSRFKRVPLQNVKKL